MLTLGEPSIESEAKVSDLAKSTLKTWAVGAIVAAAIGFAWQVGEYVHSVDKRLMRIEFKLGIDSNSPVASK